MQTPTKAISLQLALDLLCLDTALGIVNEVVDYIDIIEIGTPLIKSAGVRAISVIREAYPCMRIAADMKTIDTGAMDADLAFSNGADIVIFQASAPQQTIRAVVEETRRRGRECMIDSLGINDMIKFERIVEHSGADYAVIHTGIDEQREGFRPLERLTRISRSGKISKIAVAGGIEAQSVTPIRELLRSGIIIVGAAITKAGEPKLAAKDIRLALDR